MSGLPRPCRQARPTSPTTHFEVDEEDKVETFGLPRLRRLAHPTCPTRLDIYEDKEQDTSSPSRSHRLPRLIHPTSRPNIKEDNEPDAPGPSRLSHAPHHTTRADPGPRNPSELERAQSLMNLIQQYPWITDYLTPSAGQPGHPSRHDGAYDTYPVDSLESCDQHLETPTIQDPSTATFPPAPTTPVSVAVRPSSTTPPSAIVPSAPTTLISATVLPSSVTPLSAIIPPAPTTLVSATLHRAPTTPTPAIFPLAPTASPSATVLTNPVTPTTYASAAPVSPGFSTAVLQNIQASPGLHHSNRPVLNRT